MSLTWSTAKAAVVGTRGRALDHVGFEVKELETLCNRLEAMGVNFDRPFAKSPDSDVWDAFITNPWGTYIELTEGLDKY